MVLSFVFEYNPSKFFLIFLFSKIFYIYLNTSIINFKNIYKETIKRIKGRQCLPNVLLLKRRLFYSLNPAILLRAAVIFSGDKGPAACRTSFISLARKFASVKSTSYNFEYFSAAFFVGL